MDGWMDSTGCFYGPTKRQNHGNSGCLVWICVWGGAKDITPMNETMNFPVSYIEWMTTYLPGYPTSHS